jgi:hypothetical protein
MVSDNQEFIRIVHDQRISLGDLQVLRTRLSKLTPNIKILSGNNKGGSLGMDPSRSDYFVHQGVNPDGT